LTAKKLLNFVFWWFYVKLGLVYNILKVGQNWGMGKCPISKMTFVGFSQHYRKHNSVNFHDKSIKHSFIQVFRVNLSYESVLMMLNHPLYHI